MPRIHPSLIVTAAAMGMLGVTAASDVRADAFQSSNSIVVMRLGATGSTLSTGNANSVPMYMDEYNATSGSLIQSINLSSNAVLGTSGQSASFSGTVGLNRDGIFQRSDDGQYLAVGGYGIASGTTDPLDATTKVIARIGANGVPDYSTSYSNVGVGAPIRSVASTDGSKFWIATDGAANSLDYLPFGASSATSIQAGAWRATNVSNGQLYAVSGTSGFRGVSTVGSGAPTATGQTATTITPSPNPSTGPGVSSMFMADANTIYAAGTANPATPSGDDFREYRFENGAWVLKSSIASPDGASSAYGVTAVPSGNGFMLYLSTTAGVYKVTDTDPTDTTFPSLDANNRFINAPADEVFRGISLSPVPEPGTMAIVATVGGLAMLRRRRGQ